MTLNTDSAKWHCNVIRRAFPGDIDAYRAKYGKEEGERRFFDEVKPEDVKVHQGNMLVIGGTSCLWNILVGSGTGSANQTFTFFNNANASIGVGNSSTASTSRDEDLKSSSGSSNRQFNGMDSTFPLLYDASGGNTSAVVAISAATNASPIVITTATQSPAFVNNDFVHVFGVGGNTAANGLWQVTAVTATSLTLVGTTGNGAYTTGGFATRADVIYFRSTFGPSVANFNWVEFCVANSNPGASTLSAGRILNRGTFSLGTKPNTQSWQLGVGIYLA
jgi:hypothetical protein